MNPEYITLVVDSRETHPLEFTMCKTIRKGLKTGDYSIQGYEDKFCCERKDIKDLIGTCGHKDRDRFKRELQRMKDDFDFYCIVIDGKPEQVLEHCHNIHAMQIKENLSLSEQGLKPKRLMNPVTRAKSVSGSLRSWRSGFNCHYYFTGGREQSAKLIYDMAKRFVYNMEKRNH